ncbi:MAG: DUF6602 domain-containing protein [Cyanobacteria bacterium P01_C01_bin.118]
MAEHDIHDFIASSQRAIAEEYERIQKRAEEDLGTAGDQGEENWATLLRQWLPAYFQIVTKGRILADNGYASPQIDVLVLMPSYPQILLDKKLYLAGGVAAAFEYKTTLKAAHIKAAVQTATSLRENLPIREGSPYYELHSTILYGLLAHSHSWKGRKSNPIDNIESTLLLEDQALVKHPRQCLDYLCVADLATWSILKMTNLPPYGKDSSARTSYVCHEVGSRQQADFFSPIGKLLSGLFSDLAWTFTDMRTLEEYFRNVNLQGRGNGRMRLWDIGVYSDKIKDRVCRGELTNGLFYDEWSMYFY